MADKALSKGRDMAGKKVLIRADRAGVFFGTLIALEYTAVGAIAVLAFSRRVHYWEGAASLSQVSQEGIKQGRVAMIEPIKEVIGVIEVTPLSGAAIANLENQPVWKV